VRSVRCCSTVRDAAEAQSPYGIGRVATPAEIAGWNIDIGRDGKQPAGGKRSVATEVKYTQQCAACHGAKAKAASATGLSAGRARWQRQAGAHRRQLLAIRPTLFDTSARQPQNAPQSLSDDDVYAVSAYILSLNGLLPADATLDARTLAAIKMPNSQHVR